MDLRCQSSVHRFYIARRDAGFDDQSVVRRNDFEDWPASFNHAANGFEIGIDDGAADGGGHQCSFENVFATAQLLHGIGEVDANAVRIRRNLGRPLGIGIQDLHSRFADLLSGFGDLCKIFAVPAFDLDFRAFQPQVLRLRDQSLLQQCFFALQLFSNQFELTNCAFYLRFDAPDLVR